MDVLQLTVLDYALMVGIAIGVFVIGVLLVGKQKVKRLRIKLWGLCVDLFMDVGGGKR